MPLCRHWHRSRTAGLNWIGGADTRGRPRAGSPRRARRSQRWPGVPARTGKRSRRQRPCADRQSDRHLWPGRGSGCGERVLPTSWRLATVTVPDRQLRCTYECTLRNGQSQTFIPARGLHVTDHMPVVSLNRLTVSTQGPRFRSPIDARAARLLRDGSFRVRRSPVSRPWCGACRSDRAPCRDGPRQRATRPHRAAGRDDPPPVGRTRRIASAGRSPPRSGRPDLGG